MKKTQTERKAKTLQELTIKDAFMFAAVMSNPERCRKFLSIVLGMNVCKVTVITEKTLSYHPEYHGVRLDVLADEAGTKRRFNVEMQVKDLKNLPPRGRYYHAQMDMDLLLSGMSYNDLPDTYVIFICDFDPAGKGLYKYTNRTVCEETGEVVEDGVHTIWLSTAGTNRQDVPEELVSFLEYVHNPNAPVDETADTFVRTVERDVAAIKRNRDWEGKFMLLKEMMEDERNEGKAEGIEIGRSEGIELGRSEGQKKKSDEITLKMLQRGLPDEDILDMTGISEKHLRALKEMALAAV